MATSTSQAAQAWVSAEVKQGAATILSPTILTATAEDTFSSLLDKLGSDLQLQSQTVEKVTIAGTGPTVHVVPMGAPVAVVS